MGRFFTELRRRKVFQVAAIYAVVAWLLAQVLALILDTYGAPSWVQPTLMAILTAGLPLAVVLAWAFEVTPEGVRRTGGDSRNETGTDRQHGIAVLPFLNMSDNRDYEFLADGMTEDLITKLAFRLDMLVIARNSSFHYKGTSPDIRDVGRELGILYVLEGSVRHMGENTRITVQLIETENGGHIWSETYDRKTSEIFDVQDDVVDSIAHALDSSVRWAEQKLASHKPVGDLEVWELLARSGRGTRYTLQSQREAEEFIDKALLKDPDNVTAKVYKYRQMSSRYITFEDAVPAPELKAEVLKRIEDVAGSIERYPELITQTGRALSNIGEHRAAIELLDTDDPSLRHFTEYYIVLGYALAVTGHAHRGVELMEEGLRRDPVGFTANLWSLLATGYQAAGDYQKALAAMRKSVRQRPDSVWPWVQLSQWLIREGDTTGAVKAIASARKAMSDLTPEKLDEMYDNIGVEPSTKASLMRRFRQAWEAAGLS